MHFWHMENPFLEYFYCTSKIFNTCKNDKQGVDLSNHFSILSTVKTIKLIIHLPLLPLPPISAPGLLKAVVLLFAYSMVTNIALDRTYQQKCNFKLFKTAFIHSGQHSTFCMDVFVFFKKTHKTMAVLQTHPQNCF